MCLSWKNLKTVMKWLRQGPWLFKCLCPLQFSNTAQVDWPQQLWTGGLHIWHVLYEAFFVVITTTFLLHKKPRLYTCTSYFFVLWDATRPSDKSQELSPFLRINKFLRICCVMYARCIMKCMHAQCRKCFNASATASSVAPCSLDQGFELHYF